MAWVDPRVNEIVANLPGVQGEVRRLVRVGAARAQAKRAQHIAESNAYVDTSFGDVDGFVNLNDPGGNALSIETGRDGFVRKSDGRYIGPMRGLNIVRGAF